MLGSNLATARPRWPLLLLLLLAAVAGTFEVHNLDLFLHARTGEWIIEHGEVPQTNVLSIRNAEHPAVDDKWGFQLLAHGLLDGLGPDAVVAARVVLLLMLAGLIAVIALRRGADPRWVLLFGSLGLLAARSRFLFRPGLISMVLLLAVLHQVLVRRTDGRGLLRRLVPLQLLWVNLHGFFILGPLSVLVVAAARGLGAGLPGAGPDERAIAGRFALVGAVLLAVCLVNPAGLDGALHPVAILADLREHYDFYTSAIEEFRPTFAPDPYHSFDRTAFLVLLALSGAALVADALRRRDGETLAILVVATMFTAMSLSLRRNMAPCAIVLAPFAAAALGRSARLAGWTPRVGVLGAVLAVALMLGEAGDGINIHDGLERRWGTGLSQLAYPLGGIEFIAEHLGDREVFTAFRYGSTFSGLRFPEQAASTDGNTHGYPTADLIEALAAVSGADPSAFGRLAARDGDTVALLPMVSPLSVQLFRDPAWTPVFFGRREAVYVLASSVDPTWLAEHDLTVPLQRGVWPGGLDTPAPTTLFGVRRAWRPVAEVDQAVLLMLTGHRAVALERARRAVERAPDHGASLTLCGLLEVATGDASTGADLLRRGLAAGGVDPLSRQAREVLDGLQDSEDTGGS